MEGLVSQRWTGVAAVTVPMSIIWIAFILYDSPWTGLMWVLSVALAAAVWASRREALSGPSIGQVIAELSPSRRANAVL